MPSTYLLRKDFHRVLGGNLIEGLDQFKWLLTSGKTVSSGSYVNVEGWAGFCSIHFWFFKKLWKNYFPITRNLHFFFLWGSSGFPGLTWTKGLNFLTFGYGKSWFWRFTFWQWIEVFRRWLFHRIKKFSSFTLTIAPELRWIQMTWNTYKVLAPMSIYSRRPKLQLGLFALRVSHHRKTRRYLFPLSDGIRKMDRRRKSNYYVQLEDLWNRT